MNRLQTANKITELFNKYRRDDIDATQMAKLLAASLTNFGNQYRIDNKDEPFIDADGYDLNENMERLSCCGYVLDNDIMMCPSCKEHC